MTKPSTTHAPPPLDLVSTMIAAIHAISRATDEASLFAASLQSLSSLGHQTLYLSTFCDEARTVLEIMAGWDRGGAPPIPPGTRLSSASHPGIKKLLGGEPIVYENCATDPRIHEATRRLIVSLGVRSMALFPLVYGDLVLGALAANHHAPHEYSEDERQLLALVAQLAAVALLGIRSRKQLDDKMRLVQALYDASEALSAISEEQALLDRAVTLLVNDVGYVLTWIGLVDHDRGVLVSRAGRRRNRQYDDFIVYPLDEAGATSVAAFHQDAPVVHRDILARAEAEGWGEAARSANMRTGVYVPLRAGGESLGVLGVGSSDEGITDDEVALVAAFGNQLAAAILRARRDQERAAQLAQIEQACERQAGLLEVVRELSTPVIPVHDGVLVLPLVGTIDSTRGAQVMEALLGAITREQASVVLIDVTGVPMVDTGVADHLLRVIRAAALLGARAVLVGVTPVVAQTVVQLGVDLSGVVTRSNLQAGIAYALGLRGLQIRPIEAGRAAAAGRRSAPGGAGGG